MNFDIPQEMQSYLGELDEFIEKEIKPIENENDNIRFFDHRREDARTDWERGGLPNEEWEQLLQKAKREQPRATLGKALAAELPKNLVQELQQLWWPEIADVRLAELRSEVLADVAARLNRWELKPAATEGYRTAEVTLGGVDTNELSSRTFEAKRQPGLYFIGEVIDVTGHLGGFNFQWAWSSGFVAGQHA